MHDHTDALPAAEAHAKECRSRKDHPLFSSPRMRSRRRGPVLVLALMALTTMAPLARSSALDHTLPEHEHPLQDCLYRISQGGAHDAGCHHQDVTIYDCMPHSGGACWCTHPNNLIASAPAGEHAAKGQSGPQRTQATSTLEAAQTHRTPEERLQAYLNVYYTNNTRWSDQKTFRQPRSILRREIYAFSRLAALYPDIVVGPYPRILTKDQLKQSLIDVWNGKLPMDPTKPLDKVQGPRPGASRPVVNERETHIHFGSGCRRDHPNCAPGLDTAFFDCVEMAGGEWLCSHSAPTGPESRRGKIEAAYAAYLTANDELARRNRVDADVLGRHAWLVRHMLEAARSSVDGWDRYNSDEVAADVAANIYAETGGYQDSTLRVR